MYVCMYVCMYVGGCMKEKYMGGFSAKDKVALFYCTYHKYIHTYAYIP